MTTDKFKDVFPTPATFVGGEQPKAIKFTRWSAQTDTGMQELEKAIGNLWASFQINEDPYPLLLTNLARGIGSIDYINPYIPANVTVDGHEQETTGGVREMVLELLPNPAAVPEDFMLASTDTAIVPAQYQASRALMSTDGDWTYENRRLYTFKTMDGGGATITYNGKTGDGDLGQGFAVIPNPSQMTGADNTACSIQAWVDVGGETYYRVTLPTLQKDKKLPGELVAGVPQVGAGTVQLELPAQCQPPTGLTDDEIPPGLIFLWDCGDPFDIETAVPISSTAQYRAISATVFEIRGVELDGVTLGDPGPANNTRYFVVTMGISLAEAVGQLHKRFLQHDHSSGEFVAALSHNNLIDMVMTGTVGGVAAKNYALGSAFNNNDHPMYLYREGYVPNVDEKGTYYNAMVGDLCLASSVEGSDGYHRNTEADSVKLLFFNESGPQIYYDYVRDRLRFLSFTINGDAKNPEGGFEFGSAGQLEWEKQATFWGAVDIQNELLVIQQARFNNNVDIYGTLFVDAGGDVDIDCGMDIAGAVAMHDALTVDGLLTMDGGGQINDHVLMAADIYIDGLDPGEHIHTGGAGMGRKIPVEGIYRGGSPVTGTPVRINAAGYAVYAP